MTYGTIKVDTVTFTNDGVDKSVTLSGLVQNPTFSGNVTVTGTLSGVTVTGTTANFTSGNFANISGGTHTITSGVFAAGSAASPSITFTGDLNTGIYSPGADQVAISTSGSGQVFVSSNGNLGIGTLNVTNIAGKIHSRADGNEAKALLVLQNRDTGASAGSAINFVNGANDLSDNRHSYIRSIVTGAGQNGNHLVFGTNVNGEAPSERLRITSAGLVGIGTSSPAQILDVRAANAAGTTYISVDNTSNTATSLAGIYFSQNGTPKHSITAATFGADYMAFNIGAAGVITERLRITSAGLVGIGTSVAVNLLDVEGGVGVSYAAGLRAVRDQFTTNNIILRHQFVGSNDQLEISPVGNSPTSAIAFRTALSSTLATRMFISPSGLVGIGTTSPDYTLNVQGTVGIGKVGTSGTYNLFWAPNTIGQSVRWIRNNSGELAIGEGLIAGTNEHLRIDASGRLLVGTSAGVSAAFVNSSIQAHGLTGDNSSITLYRFTTSATAAATPRLVMARSGSDSKDFTVVANGNRLGQVNFVGADGTQFVSAASIDCEVDGTPGANDMPGRLVFSTTADGASSPTERLRITSAGLVGIGTIDPVEKLEVRDGNIGLDSAGSTVGDRTTERFYKRTDNGSTNGMAAIGMNGAGTNGFLGEIKFYTGASDVFNTSLSERVRIDSSGRLLVGTSSPYAVQNFNRSHYFAPLSGENNNQIVVSAVTTGSPAVFFTRTRGATPATFTVVQDGDNLGLLEFFGADGTDYSASGARIAAQVDGTPGANDMPGRLVFSTTADGASSPTERMRITSNGQLGAFTAAANDALYVSSGEGAGTTYRTIQARYGATENFGGTISFNVFTNGNVQNTNNSYGALSDIKLKENIVDATSQWSDIKALQVRKYNFKEGQTHTQIGLVAQEVELVSPGLVSESPDRDEDGNDLGTVTKSVNYSVLYMKAVKALQEAMERIEQLEQRLTDAGIA